MIDADTLTPPPDTPKPEQDPKPLREEVKGALDARDAETLVVLLEPLPPSAALRQLLLLSAEDRDLLLALIPEGLAARLIVEAPLEAAIGLVARLATDRAADVLNELNSDLQADIIGNLGPEEAHAILARLHPDDAADVRRLTEYEGSTAGGLMAAEAFKFPETATVGAVLRGIVSDNADFERYRGQHPYVVDPEGRPVRSRRRLAWLSANIVPNIVAASVISAYEETLAAVIAMAIFLPMVSDMSGCSGNQAVGVTMR